MIACIFVAKAKFTFAERVGPFPFAVVTCVDEQWPARSAWRRMRLLMVSSVPVSGWSANWAWGLPLIVGTVLFHVAGLGLVRQRTKRFSARSIKRHYPTAAFIIVMGGATLLATSLHAIEAGIWAVAYLGLRALPDFKSAMLFSLDAITSYGHVNLNLEQHWHLMGSLEALNGWLLFGLTTAFLFGMLDEVWRSDKS